MGPRDTGMPNIQEMSPTVVFCPLPRAPQLPPLVTEAGNHRGEDTHQQNAGHKNESLELLAKQTALVAVHSLALFPNRLKYHWHHLTLQKPLGGNKNHELWGSCAGLPLGWWVV